MRKYIVLIGFFWVIGNGYSQETEKPNFIMHVGLVYNQSNLDPNSMTAIGFYFEPKFIISHHFILGYRFEPLALMYGVSVLDGECNTNLSSSSDFTSCKEGANYVLNNYVFTDYRLGSAKYGPKGGLRQFYAGVSMNLYTHNRYILPISSNKNQQWVANVAPGIRFGAHLGRIQANLSYNLAGKDFQPFVGTSIGYQIIR
ncbi:MAG: hypothetical protein ACXIUQ_01130 [Cecembia sp.]